MDMLCKVNVYLKMRFQNFPQPCLESVALLIHKYYVECIRFCKVTHSGAVRCLANSNSRQDEDTQPALPAHSISIVAYLVISSKF